MDYWLEKSLLAMLYVVDPLSDDPTKKLQKVDTFIELSKKPSSNHTTILQLMSSKGN